MGTVAKGVFQFFISNAPKRQNLRSPHGLGLRTMELQGLEFCGGPRRKPIGMLNLAANVHEGHRFHLNPKPITSRNPRALSLYHIALRVQGPNDHVLSQNPYYKVVYWVGLWVP